MTIAAAGGGGSGGGEGVVDPGKREERAEDLPDVVAVRRRAIEHLGSAERKNITFVSEVPRFSPLPFSKSPSLNSTLPPNRTRIRYLFSPSQRWRHERTNSGRDQSISLNNIKSLKILQQSTCI